MGRIKEVLITGVAGMIGSHLADSLLAKGYRVLGVDDLSVGKMEHITQNLNNTNFTFHKINILNYEALEKICPDSGLEAIVHMAASKKIAEDGNSLEVLLNNVRGTESALKLAKRAKCRFILGSTSDVYGMSSDIPFKEDGNLLLGPTVARRWSYAVSKIYSEQLAFAYYKEHQVPIVIVRYFGGFSPRASFDWRSGHIPVFIDAILNNREIVIHGDGTQTRSMGYVTDLVRGTVLAMQNLDAVGEIINIGNDEELSIIDTAYLIKKVVEEVTGKSVKLKLKFIPFREVFGKYRDIMRRVPDLSKARKLLGYEPKVKLEDGLRKTVVGRVAYLT